MPNPICTIDGCNTPSRTGRAIYCGMHYLRWYKHGDANYARPAYERCTVEGCEHAPRSHSSPHCEKHYYRIRRNGDPLIVIDTRRDDATYRAAHSRIDRDKGKARDRACVDCGARAHHWSYDHTDMHEMLSPTGQPYSLDINCYEPRCAPCHAVFDGTGANQYTR